MLKVSETGVFIISPGLSEVGYLPSDNILVSLLYAPSGPPPVPLAPITTISPEPTEYAAGLAITLTCNTDATIKFSINGTAERVYTVPFTIVSNATITYYATDLAGTTEAVKTAVYVIDSTGFTEYTEPIHLDNDTTIKYYLEHDGEIEHLRQSHYVIDLNPLVITGVPDYKVSRPRKIVNVAFTPSKDCAIKYSFNYGPWIDYTGMFALPEGEITLRYYAVSEGRTYPIESKQYTVKPNLKLTVASPRPDEVTNTPTFTVTLGKI